MHTLFNNGNRGTECLEAVLALDDTRVMVGSAAHTQPVAPYPFAAARDDRLAGHERRAHLERVRQRLGCQYSRQLPRDCRRSFDLSREMGDGQAAELHGRHGAIVTGARHTRSVY